MVPNAQALHARWVIPVEPAGQVLEHHTVVIENATIRAVLPTSEWRSPGPGMDELTLAEHALIPGLVNTHHHFYQTLTRVVRPAQDRELFGWLQTLYPIWSRLTPEMAYVSTQTAMAELLLSGCTTSTARMSTLGSTSSSRRGRGSSSAIRAMSVQVST